MEKVLIDTNILIGITRNQPGAEAAVKRVAGAQLVLCDIVLSEVLDGAKNKAEHVLLINELLIQFEILPFTPKVSTQFREILAQGGHERGSYLADRLIAAIAIAHDCALLTLNQKHFKSIKGLRLA